MAATDNWLDVILMVLDQSAPAGWNGLLSPRSLRRLAWLAAALAVLAGCGLASALMGSVWPLALAGVGMGLLAGAAWLGPGRGNRTG